MLEVFWKPSQAISISSFDVIFCPYFKYELDSNFMHKKTKKNEWNFYVCSIPKYSVIQNEQ